LPEPYSIHLSIDSTLFNLSAFSLSTEKAFALERRPNILEAITFMKRRMKERKEKTTLSEWVTVQQGEIEI